MRNDVVNTTEGLSKKPMGQIPFGCDYRDVNALNFLIKSRVTGKAMHEIEREIKNKFLILFNIAQSMIVNPENDTNNTFTEWQKYIVYSYASYVKNNKIPSSFDNFISFVLSSADIFLPDQYTSNQPTNLVEQLFPSSNIGHLLVENDFIFAHIQKDNDSTGGIIVSNVPQQKRTFDFEQDEKYNKKAIQSFLKMLWDNAIAQIVCLGRNRERIDYANAENDTFKTNTHNEIITITNKNTHETRMIKLIRLQVGDQQSLNPNNNELQQLLDTYHDSKNKIILIHCDSGVGRTGQIRLLFSLLDAYKNDSKFQVICDNLLKKLLEKKPIEQTIQIYTQYIYNKMTKLLSKLRKQRYCVESLNQFSGTLPLLLLALHKDLYPDAMEHLNILRQKMDMEIHASLFETTGSFFLKHESSENFDNFEHIEINDIEINDIEINDDEKLSFPGFYM